MTSLATRGEEEGGEEEKKKGDRKNILILSILSPSPPSWHLVLLGLP